MPRCQVKDCSDYHIFLIFNETTIQRRLALGPCLRGNNSWRIKKITALSAPARSTLDNKMFPVRGVYYEPRNVASGQLRISFQRVADRELNFLTRRH